MSRIISEYTTLDFGVNRPIVSALVDCLTDRAKEELTERLSNEIAIHCEAERQLGRTAKELKVQLAEAERRVSDLADRRDWLLAKIQRYAARVGEVIEDFELRPGSAQCPSCGELMVKYGGKGHQTDCRFCRVAGETQHYAAGMVMVNYRSSYKNCNQSAPARPVTGEARGEI